MTEFIDTIPPDFMVESNGMQVPARDVPFFKEAKDFPTFLKTAYDAHREVGARLPLKVDKTKPETITAWQKDNLPRLYEAGVLQAPPAKPEDYEIKRPGELPVHIAWNDDNAKALAMVLHKHGVPKAAAADLLALHTQAISHTQEAFKTEHAAGVAKLKAEFGDQYDNRMEMVKRLTPMIFKDEKELALIDNLGLGNHPGFMGIMLRLAHLGSSDSSFMRDVVHAGGGMSAEDVKTEMSAIMSDPKHAMYEGYRRKDKTVMEHVENLYKKAYGDKKVDLGGGVAVTGRT